jgi:hypothetical protein
MRNTPHLSSSKEGEEVIKSDLMVIATNEFLGLMTTGNGVFTVRSHEIWIND